jgi:UDP-N-acetylmuramate--alanine ligase
LTNSRRVHFVGIGGTGMAPLATILLQSGIKVSGSDCKDSPALSKFRQAGVRVSLGHSASNLDSPDLVVVSLAVNGTNPEVVEAERLGIPVVTRAQLLGSLFNEKRGIAVSGTHGKTTTASMIAYVLEMAGYEPTIAVGGEIVDLGFGGKLGGGQHFVAEADEAYKSFLELKPSVSVVTSIDDDHVDHYGSFEGVIDGFRRFIEQTQPDGYLVACADDPNVLTATEGYQGRAVFYGQKGGDYVVQNLRIEGRSWRFTVRRRGGAVEMSLRVPGLHNALNATATLAVCEWLGVHCDRVSALLAKFSGARRRSELIGTAGGIAVYDDYAHHPSEIQATLRAFRARHSGRLVVVFQPQRFSRTRLLMNRFAGAFSDADLVVVDDIFYRGTGEAPLEGVNSGRLAELIKSSSGKPAFYISGKEEIVRFLSEHVENGDLIITMGAGDIRECAVRLVEAFGGRIA